MLNWTVLADPFYAMHKRTKFSTKSIASLTPEEAVTAVMGDEVAGRVLEHGKINAASKTQATLFATWCYLRLRQAQTLTFPIKVGEKFSIAELDNDVPLTGMRTLKEYGQYTTVRSNASDVLKKLSKQGVVKEMTKAHRLERWCVKHALLTGAMAMEAPEIKLLTYKLAQPVVEKVFGSLESVVYVDHNWTRCFDFHVTQLDVAVVCDWLAKTLPKANIEVHPCGNDFVLCLDEHEFLVTKKDGVFELSRNLRFNNMLLISPLTGRSLEEQVPVEDMSLVNSYGTFLYGLIMLGAKYLTAPIPELGQLISKKMLIELPTSSDDEAKASDGDRNFYDRYVTVTKFGPAELPFGFVNLPNGKMKVVYNREIGVNNLGAVKEDVWESKLPAKHCVDRGALLGFNLVRVPRGQFIDGRKACIQAKHVPAEIRSAFVESVLQQVCGDLSPAEYARKFFGIQGSDTEVINVVSEHLLVGLSNKLAKLIKRTAMDSACVGFIESGASRGFKRLGQPEVSENNWLIEAVISPHAIFPAGVAAYWGEKPVLRVSHTQRVQPNLPGTLNEISKSVVPLLKGNETVWHNGWYEITFPSLPVEVGEPVCDIPYSTESGEFRHTICNNVPDGRLLKIRWRLTPTIGNKTTLEVALVTETLETQIKGRNNVKCMLSRYTPDVLSLNSGLKARSVFFADTNKWLDLAMSLTDVAACTAIQNQDAFGLDLIKQCNVLVGENTTEYLVWSPVLAVMGYYQPLIDWFESKFGRAVWFKHADPTGEWVHVLRTMYSRAEWQAVQPWKLKEVLPPKAERVVCLADGCLSNPKTNVLVFYCLDGIEYFIQRAWSYAGTLETGPVYQPVKAELSSVQASVGKTPLMAGVARAVEQQDPAFAQRLVRDGFRQIHKSAVFFAMAKNQTIKAKGAELPMYTLGDSEAAAMLQTQEIKEMVNNPANAGKLLPLLAQHFKHCMFRVCAGTAGSFSIYLPAVVAQDANTDFRSANSFSDLVTQLFVLYINGASEKELTQIANRAKGALIKLTQSGGLLKSAAFGRMSVQAKTIALPGVPTSEVWVKKSHSKRSVYHLMSRTFEMEDNK